MIKKEETFNKHGLALGALAIAFPLLLKKKRTIGIQLWTLRDTLPKDVKGVLAQVGNWIFRRNFGYSLNTDFWYIRA
jgi:hypothetical protein